MTNGKSEQFFNGGRLTHLSHRDDFERWLEQGETLLRHVGGGASETSSDTSRTTPGSDDLLKIFQCKTLVIIPPHPDDEVLMGGIALRLKQSVGTEVHVVPFSLGSKADRKRARAEEQTNACAVLGFSYHAGEGVGFVEERLVDIQPDLVVCPAETDGHPTHLATHKAVMALVSAQKVKPLFLVTSEYWGFLERPNLGVNYDRSLVAQLMSALSQHVGEVERQPFLETLPSYLRDQSRRASEKIGGFGASFRISSYAQMYQAYRVKSGTLTELECVIL